MTRRDFLNGLSLAAGAVMVFAGAGTGQTDAQAGSPAIPLKPGEFYFRIAGKCSFLLGRNPTGWRVEQFEPLFKWAGESGEQIVRIHLTNGMPPSGPVGEVDESWARKWDRVFDMAAQNALYVLPVFGVWADWNDGSKREAWHRWDKNRFNITLGGPAGQPVELFRDTSCRKLWLQWMQKLVARWQGRSNILGWEVFSELDLVTGASEAEAAGFAERAAAGARAADGLGRPITASLSGIGHWPKLFRSPALDFIQIHPYADHPKFHGNLDEMILESVRERLTQYGKPVLIGECGLCSVLKADSLAMSPGAETGIRHAIWASAVSGAMNGRMLWWEDGYDQYERVDLRTRYKDASAPVAQFVKDVDYSGFKPVKTVESAGLKGAALGNERLALAWFRDASCSAPGWPVRRLDGQAVRLAAPGPAPGWRVEFCDTGAGKVFQKLPVPLVASNQCHSEDHEVRVPLPPFEGSIAFKMFAIKS